MSFLPSLGSKSRASDMGLQTGGTAIERAAGGQGFYSVTGTPYVSDWNLDRAMTEGMERSLWVFRCVDAIASAQAGLTIEYRKDGEDGPVIEDKPLHKVLNKRASPAESAEAFRYRLSAILLLSKMGVFIERTDGKGGRAVQLTILPPGRTAPIPDPTKPSGVGGFRVDVGNGNSYLLPPEKVIWIRQRPHLTKFYEQLTPLEAAGLTIDVDFYARLYNRNFMLNDGRPGGLISIKGQISRDDLAEVKRRFSGGPSSAGRATVLAAEDVNWVDTATTPRDAQYKDLMDMTKQHILLAFGVPESVMGNASGRTYDNAEAEENVFWRQTMIPHMRAIAGAMDVLTLGGMEDENVLVFNTDNVAALQLDNRRRRAEALASWQAGVITLTQYYEEIEEELPKDLDIPAARVFLIPAGKIPAGTDEDTAAAQALMPMGTPPMPDPNAQNDDPFADPGNMEQGGAEHAAGQVMDIAHQYGVAMPPGAGASATPAPRQSSLDSSYHYSFKDLAPEDLTDDEFRDFALLGVKSLADILVERKDRVASPAGADRFGQPIGSVIRPDVPGVHATAPHRERLTGVAARAQQMIDSMADHITRRAEAAEPNISAELQALAVERGAKLTGFENRLKKKERIAAKIAEVTREKGLPVDAAAADIKDAVRYTLLADEPSYMPLADHVVEHFQKRGFRVIKNQNSWADPADPTRGAYRGINMNFEEPETGQVFELQVHTEHSFRTKEYEQHPLYEIQRHLPERNAEWKALEQQMVEMGDRVPIPPGAVHLTTSV